MLEFRPNITFGFTLGAGAIMNMMRYCGRSGDTKNDEPALV